MSQFWSEHLGDIASVLGVLISLAGFYWAIRQARGAQVAAQRAEAAVAALRKAMATFDVGMDLIGAVDEIDRAREVLAEGGGRSAGPLRAARRAVIRAQVGLRDLPAATRSGLQYTIEVLTEAQASLLAGTVVPDLASKLDREADRLTRLHAELRAQVGDA